MYQALYRKWRPIKFEDVVGQDHITSVLKSEIDTKKVSHAYIFCGPRGTGKTTCAKIISKAVNCESPINGDPCCKCPSCLAIENGTTTDILEIDAASNNGVDNVRDIREMVQFTPNDLKYRVYIIDEVHMLSTGAFNALLKTLEEPPSHVIFILATTELNKIPATVLSRCQRFDFHRISNEAMMFRLKKISKEENIDIDDESLSLISRLSQGGLRDALNMLEFCSNSKDVIRIKDSAEMLGAVSNEMFIDISNAIVKGDISHAIEICDNVDKSSKSISFFWRELIAFYRDTLVFLSTKGKKCADTIASTISSNYTVPELFSIISILTDAEKEMQKLPSHAKLYAEMALIKVCTPEYRSEESILENRISELEKIIKSGNITVSAKEPTKTESKKEKVEVAKEDQTKAIKEPTKEEIKEEPTRAILKEKKVKWNEPVRSWKNVLDAYKAKDFMSASILLGSSRAFKSDEKLTVEYINPMVEDRIKNNDAKLNIFIEVINSKLQTSYTKDQIEFVWESSGKIEIDPMEELSSTIESLNN